jgi:hypothetical protein
MPGISRDLWWKVRQRKNSLFVVRKVNYHDLQQSSHLGCSVQHFSVHEVCGLLDCVHWILGHWLTIALLSLASVSFPCSCPDASTTAEPPTCVPQ